MKFLKRLKAVIVKGILNRVFFLYILMGVMFYGVIDHNRLITNYVNFLMQSETDVKDFCLGKAALNASALKMAARYYQQLVKFAPNDGIIRGNLGFCYFYLGDSSRAIEEYRHGIMLEPVFGSLHWDMAMILFQMGEVKESANIWDSYLQNINAIKGFSSALKNQLRALKKEDAIVLIDLMDQRSKEDEKETYIKLSEAYYILKNYGDSQQIALDGLKKYPGNRWLHYVAGLSFFAEGHFSQAADHFNEAIAGDAQDINSYYYHSLCMEQLGFLNERVKDLRRLTQLRDQGIEPHPFPKNDVHLHFNTELLLIRYHMKDLGTNS